ncbi:polyribonucleotide nucleotidyltransferase [soil metagenome]
MSEFTLRSTDGLNFTEHVIEIPYGQGKTLELRTGKLAKQAAGAVLARVGDTIALVAVVVSDFADESKDFFPLMVDYREKFYAGGRIPGGFFKREARPSDGETLRARVIDRTIRPLFPEGFKNEVQVYVTIISTDRQNPADLVAMAGASAALHISQIPLLKAVAGTRVGLIDGKLILNPTFEETVESQLDLIVAGHADGINMVECGAKEIDEDTLVEALEQAHENIRVITRGIDALREVCGKPKMKFVPAEKNKGVLAEVAKLMPPHVIEIQNTHDKSARDARVAKAVTEISAQLAEKYPDLESEISAAVYLIDEKAMRRRVIKDGIRADGRRPTEIRPIWTEVDVLPSAHGSSIFTRGQTQALAVVTLGSVDDKQMMDDMHGLTFKNFMLHYNFPSYSVGEARPPRGPGRREIGHGALAERAISAVLPPVTEFPYTIRSVVEILESNGSSSMATVCSTSMALMDAGVPLKAPVAGIAMGLITNDDGELEVLTDIQGIEDHVGDMDFKVAGTTKGVTALQMDIKVEGITREVLERALRQAKDAREFILSKMEEGIKGTRGEMKPNTPRITTIHIPQDKIREVIGSGGKVIRDIVEKSGAKVDIEDDGTCYVMAEDQEAAKRALAMINGIIRTFEEGEIITCKIIRIIEHGAIVDLGGGKDGMVHISELEHRRVGTVEEVVKEGQEITVKVLEVDKERGRVRLSRKALLPKPEGMPEGGGGGGREDRGDRGDRPERGGFRGGGDRGGRGGERSGGGGGGYRGGGGGGGDRDRAPREGGEREARPAGGEDREPREPRDPRGEDRGGDRGAPRDRERGGERSGNRADREPRGERSGNRDAAPPRQDPDVQPYTGGGNAPARDEGRPSDGGAPVEGQRPRRPRPPRDRAPEAGGDDRD